MTRYFVEVQKVDKDFYTGVESYSWIRRKEVFETKEDALKVAKRCRNAWIVIEAKFDEKAFRIKEKIVADHLHN